ncbi:MAG: radical SAM family heme chaperone HemW [Actinomycetota bacterium]|nr:radical SAM family heme chaperone HemW [Actinomycetota bacterium]
MSLPAPVVAPGRSGEWMSDPGFGIYIHIPFCKHRCHYCDFNTYEGQDDLHGGYVDALVTEIERWDGAARPATSVFFGGGTPTLLEPRELGRILRAVRARVGLSADAEVTVEANPETVDEPYLAALLEEGFGRISVGVQSLVPKVLLGLGRTHPPGIALAALDAARSAGFTDINADLIYGSPWEDEQDWQRSLEGVLESDVQHVSAYALTVEEGTPLGTLVRSGRTADVDPDVQAQRHAVADELLGGGGFWRYEISNWSKPGRASRHNVLYWSAGDYLGFGAGAHAHVAGERWCATRLPRDFIDAVASGASTRAGSELLDEDARAGEALMLGLRLRAGVDLEGFAERFGTWSLMRRAETLDRLQEVGLVERAGTCLRLSDRGTLLANEAVCELL